MKFFKWLEPNFIFLIGINRLINRKKKKIQKNFNFYSNLFALIQNQIPKTSAQLWSLVFSLGFIPTKLNY